MWVIDQSFPRSLTCLGSRPPKRNPFNMHPAPQRHRESTIKARKKEEEEVAKEVAERCLLQQ